MSRESLGALGGSFRGFGGGEFRGLREFMEFRALGLRGVQGGSEASWPCKGLLSCLGFGEICSSRNTSAARTPKGSKHHEETSVYSIQNESSGQLIVQAAFEGLISATLNPKP